MMKRKHIGVIFNLKYCIKKITYINDSGYAILKAEILEHDSSDDFGKLPITIKGYFNTVYEGDIYTAEVMLLEDKSYGYYLQITGMNLLKVPHQSKELVKFIKKRTKGIGELLLRRTVDYVGLNFIDKIKKDPEILMNVEGMTKKKAKQLYDKIIAHTYFEDLTVYLTTNDISSNIANEIYELWGEASLYKIKKNPYAICRIKEVNFTKADCLAKSEEIKHDSPLRIQNSIYQYIYSKIESAGDLCVKKNEIINDLNDYLHKYGAYKDCPDLDKEIINQEINKMLKKQKLVKEPIENDANDCWVYLPNYLQVENEVVSLITNMRHTKYLGWIGHDMIDGFLKQSEIQTGFKYAEKQKQAVHMALTNKISILSGGPGTGKTQTTNAIVQCVKNLKPYLKIVLLAPTGRASNRITELTGYQAYTIHRKLKINSFSGDNKIKQNIEDDTIDGDIIIVDESSMVDIFIFKELLSRISESSSLLLVGDFEQLPSVGPGLVLRDLIKSQVIPTTILDEIFRQGLDSQIVMNSKKLLSCTNPSDIQSLTFDKKKDDFDFYTEISQEDIRTKIIDIYGDLLNQGYTKNDIFLLSPLRKGELGTEILNYMLQAKYNPKNPAIDDYYINTNTFFRMNDKVINIKNNSDLDIYNGDTGVVEFIGYVDEYSTEESIGVKFPNKEDLIYFSRNLASTSLELAYAITIHKSQGSEYPIIIMPIAGVHESVMLTKNLIYTGWTRAKKKVICIGDKKVLEKVVGKKHVIERRSQLKEKLVKFNEII